MPTSPLHAVSAYYSGTLQRFGATPLGVDWPNRLNQELRLVQLLKVCDLSAPRSLNDVGCGYGALRTLLSRRHRRAQIDLLGTDVSPAMVAAARRRWRHRADCAFEVAEGAVRLADYSLASGIFNVKLACPLPEWEALVEPAAFAAAQIARMSGDRSRDLSPELRQQVARRLAASKAPASWAAMVQSAVQLDEADQRRSFGEALPPGLKWLGSSF